MRDDSQRPVASADTTALSRALEAIQEAKTLVQEARIEMAQRRDGLLTDAELLVKLENDHG